MAKSKIFCVTVSVAVLSAGAASFHINQVGYDLGKPVHVVVQSTENLQGSSYSLLQNGVLKSTGILGAGENPDGWLSAGNFYSIQLGNSLPAGNYTLKLSNGSTSDAFSVESNALASQTLASVLNYFQEDRADDSQILSWDASVSVFGSSGVSRDVRGGWYDASGDVSKYLSHLSYANYLNPQQIPMTVWALIFTAEHIPTTLSTISSKTDPESEALYGADFLLRMLSEDGFFYMTVFDNWGSGSRYLCAFSGQDGEKSADYQAAFREGGGMAIAALAKASSLKKNGDSTSAQYLAGAQRAFEHLQKQQTIGSVCAYCDDKQENIIDDYTALLAATELFAASGDSAYLNAARARAEHLAGRLADDGFFWSDNEKTRPFWHASDAGLPLIALVRYLEEEAKRGTSESALATQVAQAAKKHLNWLLTVTEEVANPFGYARQTYKTQNKIKNGFFIPHDNESGYWWQGESARIASLSAAAMYAAKALGAENETVQKYAQNQLDWILGKNPYSVCMMQGKGKKNPPKYSGQSSYAHTLNGGIANGISGVNTDGSGIVWNNTEAAGFIEPWQNWRWIEQWLPHATWYLMAVAARYDEVTQALNSGTSISQTQKVRRFSVQFQNRNLTVNLQQNATGRLVSLVKLNGQKVLEKRLDAAVTEINLERIPQGVYFVHVTGLETYKIQIQ